MVAINTKSTPGCCNPLSQIPSGPLVGLPLVEVCGASSPFKNIILSPTFAVAIAGTKHRFVTSHPGSDEPRPFSILISSANALSNPIPVIARDIESTSNPIPNFFIILCP